MTTATALLEDLADRLQARLEALNTYIAADDPQTPHFAFGIGVEDLDGLLTALAMRPALWIDLQALLPSLDGADALRGLLAGLARAAGELDEAIEQLEACLGADVPASLRKRVGHDLQDLKRNLWHCRRCPPYGELAERIDRAVGGPVLDGLTLAGVAYVLGTNLGLLGAFAVAVELRRASETETWRP